MCISCDSHVTHMVQAVVCCQAPTPQCQASRLQASSARATSRLSWSQEHSPAGCQQETAGLAAQPGFL